MTLRDARKAENDPFESEPRSINININGKYTKYANVDILNIKHYLMSIINGGVINCIQFLTHEIIGKAL